MSNSYYNHGSYPVTGAPGASAALRAELDLVTAGFALLPTLSGNANKALVIDSGGTAVTVTTGTLALAGNLATTGAYNTTLIQGASTSLTLPLVNGTLATLAGTETLSNKTIAASTLSGTVSGGGNQINNVIVGASTPLAGTFTTLTATTANVTGVATLATGAVLNTPASMTATNITGTAAGLTAGNVTTNANLTGDVTSVGNATTLTNAPVIAKVLTGYVSGAGTVAATDSILQAIQKLNGNDATNANLTGAITSVGNATSLGSFSSANLATALTDETGTGANVFATSPTLVTPALGTPASGIMTNVTGTAAGLTAGNVTTNANLTGDVTSVGNATTLATVATAGSTGSSTAIPVITINAKGLTTSISTAAVVAPAGTLTGATLASNVLASSLTSLGTIASLTATAGTVATTPSGNTDIANKLYVDTVAQGLDTKMSCIAATTANITLSGTQTVDGVVLIATDRVLVKNQTASAANGIYLCAAGAWTRTTDADTWDELRSAFVFVEKGTLYADTGWTCTIDSGGTLGTTAVTWAQFSGAGSYTAGTGLTLTGTAFSLTSPVATTLGGTNLTSFTANGVMYASSTSALATGSVFTYSANGNLVVGVPTTGTALAVTGTSGTYAVEITSTNTSINNRTLNVYNSAATGTTALTNQIVRLASNGSGADCTLQFTDSVANNGYIGMKSGALNFGANTTTTQMTLDTSGNLGVGTSSPGSFSGTVKLVVGSAATTTTPGAVTVYSGNATYGGLYFADGTVGDQLYRGAVEYNHSTDALLMYSAGSERARIDTSGNLGLGVTPSAWGSINGGALQMGAGYTSLYSYSNAATLGSNVYYNAGNKYFASGVGSSAYQQLGGVHYWLNAPSGTAGNAITFTQAMTLDASGNLVLGNSSAAAFLDINGGISASSAAPAARFVRNNGGNAYSNLTGLQIYWNHSNGDQESNIVYGGASTSYITFTRNNAGTFTETARIDASGNLGIGTSSPTQRLEVSGGASAGLMTVSTTSASAGSAIKLIGSTSAYKNWQISNSYAAVNGALEFTPSTAAGGTTFSTPAMLIDSSGNLGIGTSSPTTLVTMLGTTSKQAVLKMQAASGGTGGFKRNTIQMRDDTGAAGYDIVQLGDGGNALTFDSVAGSTPTTRITFDSSGHLGIGAAPPAGVPLYVSNSGAYAWLNTTTSGYSNVTGFDNGVQRWAVGQSAFGGADGMQFFYGTTEGMRLDSSGNLLVGTPSTLANGRMSVYNSSTGNGIDARIVGSGTAYSVYTARVDNTANLLHTFFYGNYSTVVGSITTNGTITVYNTTSDYRLKEFVAPVTNAGERIDALNPVEFDWKSDGSRARGFFAHEFQQVYASSVNGTKDAVDEDGNPVYQTMQASTSEVIADLVAEIKSLRVRLNALENK